MQARRIGKRLGGKWVLTGVELTLEPGVCTLLTGANGAGKTTLLKVLSLLTPPTLGEIRVGDEKAQVDAPHLRSRIGVLFHESMLYERMTAAENLQFFARLYRVDRPGEAVDTWLRKVGLTLFRNDPVRRFSQGMRQRLAIARASIHDPDFYLLDEPYSGLDEQGLEMFSELLRDAKRRGKSILVSTHDWERPAAVADRRRHLSGGRLYPRALSGRGAPGLDKGSARGASG